MTLLLTACHLLAILLMPFLLVGIIARTKALWAGRRGPRLLQSAYDVTRLLRKRAVYSKTTTSLFRNGALVAPSQNDVPNERPSDADPAEPSRRG